MQLKHVISSKVFQVFKNGQKKCPKLSLPKYFPQNNMFRSTCVGIFQGVFFRKILHSCREMSQFSGPHLYIIYILKGEPIYFFATNRSNSFMSMCGKFTCDSQKYLQYAHTKVQSELYQLLWFFIKLSYKLSGRSRKLCLGKT